MAVHYSLALWVELLLGENLIYTYDSCPRVDSAEVAAVGSTPQTGVVVSSLCLSHKNINTALSCPSCCAGTLPGGCPSLTTPPHLK